MDDPTSKSLRERLDALLKRAREISAEIERRVEEVTTDPAETHEVEQEAHSAEGGTPDAPDANAAEAARVPSPANLQAASQAIELAAEAVAVTAEAAAVTAEALSTIASENAGGSPPEIPPAPAGAPTTVVPEAAIAVAADAKEAGEKNGAKESPAAAAPPEAPPSKPDTPGESET
jgi:hypothetical protein